MSETIYLDSASTAVRHPSYVSRAMARSLSMGFPGEGGGSCPEEARQLLDETRSLAASLFGAPSPEHVIFTRGATEALNIAIRGSLRFGETAVTTALEHESVLRPLKAFTEEAALLTESYHFRTKRGWKPVSGFSVTGLTENGLLDYEELRTAAIRKRPKLIAVTHASPVTGERIDLKRISSIAREAGSLLVVDASQTAGIFPVRMIEDGIDMLCVSGHKGLMGPQGTGLLILGERAAPQPLLFGSSLSDSSCLNLPEQLPDRYEAGNPSLPCAAGLNAGLSWIRLCGISHIRSHVQECTRLFYEGVKDVPGISFLGDAGDYDRAPVISLNIRDRSSMYVTKELFRRYGIVTRAGSHGAPLTHQSLGSSRQGAVRFSFSAFTTFGEVESAVRAVKEIADA